MQIIDLVVRKENTSVEFNLKLKITCRKEPCRRNQFGGKRMNEVERVATSVCSGRSHRPSSSRTWQSGGSGPEALRTWRICHRASSLSSPPHRRVQRACTPPSICVPDTPSPRSVPRTDPAPSYTSSISSSSVIINHHLSSFPIHK